MSIFDGIKKDIEELKKDTSKLQESIERLISVTNEALEKRQSMPNQREISGQEESFWKQGFMCFLVNHNGKYFEPELKQEVEGIEKFYEELAEQAIINFFNSNPDGGDCKDNRRSLLDLISEQDKEAWKDGFLFSRNKQSNQLPK